GWMHGVNWSEVRDKYLPLASRIRDRAELSDVLSQMISELSVLHSFVRGGDVRRGEDQIQLASLGAQLERDTEAGGYVVKHVYRYDPDRPDKTPPLARPGGDVGEGDVIVAVKGRQTPLGPDVGTLFRAKGNQPGPLAMA